MKMYQVIFQDEWNNLYHIGFFKDLDDALPEINSYLEDYHIKPLEKGDLKERPSTFSSVFDIELFDEDEETAVYIRGFIFDNIEEEIKSN